MAKKIDKILVLIAMEAEAQPLVEALKLTRDTPPLVAPPAPVVTYTGQVKEATVHVACNGKCKVHGVDNVGTVPAALTAYLGIQQLQPDLVISLGTAGGFKAKGGSIGDVYVSTAFANHDRHIPIPGFDKYGVWAQDAVPTPSLQRALKLKNLRGRGGHFSERSRRVVLLQSGVVSSGNNLGYSDADWKQLQDNDAAVKEMEAAGIAWAAHLFELPFFALKSVTDIVDGDRPPQEEFLENLEKAAHALKDTLPLVLDFVAGRSVSDL